MILKVFHTLNTRGLLFMWRGMDPELRRQLATVRQLVALSRQTPTHEWPLAVVHKYDSMLVVREWPDGSLTAYMMSPHDTQHDKA